MCFCFEQNVHALQSNQHSSAFHRPFPLPHFYHPSHAAPPPLFHMSPTVMPPLSPPAVQPKFTFEPYTRNTVEVAKEPLEHLRYLAERYKSSSGLSEPLNLSVRAPKREAPSGLASSFAPPLSFKNPKFLNKPSPLYSHPVPKVARSEQCEAPVDGEEVSGQSTLSPPSSEKQSSPKTSDPVAQPSERRAGSPDARGAPFNRLLTAALPRENHKGEMEIEIPLSVFQKWLQLCKFSEQRRPPDSQREQHSLQRGALHTGEGPNQNLTPQVNPLMAEDLSLKRPASGAQQRHHQTGRYPFSSYNPQPPLGVSQGPSSLDGKHQMQQHRDVPRPPATTVKFPDGLSACEQRISSSDPLRVQQCREVSRSYREDICQRKERSDTSPPAVLFLNSSGSSPLLQLTSDEVMKLKKIISNSS